MRKKREKFDHIAGTYGEAVWSSRLYGGDCWIFDEGRLSSSKRKKKEKPVAHDGNGGCECGN